MDTGSTTDILISAISLCSLFMFSFPVHFLMLNCFLWCTGPVSLNYLALHVKNGGPLSYYVTLHKYRNENLHSLRGKKMENILNLLQWEKEMWETPDSPGLVDNAWNWTRMKTWLEASMLQTEKHKPLLKLPVEPRIENTQRDDSRVNRSHSLTLPIWFSIMRSPCVCSQSIISVFSDVWPWYHQHQACHSCQRKDTLYFSFQSARTH